MLPYFHSVDEAAHFVAAVDGRARTVLLVETGSAAARVGQLCRIEGLDEIHFGLNDLSLDLGVKNHFAVLCSTLLEEACATLAAAGFPFAVGGIGRALDASLPIPSELVYAQYPRLGATGALVSRVFFKDLPQEQFAAGSDPRPRAADLLVTTVHQQAARGARGTACAGGGRREPGRPVSRAAPPPATVSRWSACFQAGQLDDCEALAQELVRDYPDAARPGSCSA